MFHISLFLNDLRYIFCHSVSRFILQFASWIFHANSAGHCITTIQSDMLDSSYSIQVSDVFNSEHLNTNSRCLRESSVGLKALTVLMFSTSTKTNMLLFFSSVPLCSLCSLSPPCSVLLRLAVALTLRERLAQMKAVWRSTRWLKVSQRGWVISSPKVIFTLVVLWAN